MNINRREFVGAALAGGVSTAQTTESPCPLKEEIPTQKRKSSKSSNRRHEHPNALEATPDALWVGGQVSEIAYKLDWKTHNVLHQVQTESHTTSGMAVGGGNL